MNQPPPDLLQEAASGFGFIHSRLKPPDLSRIMRRLRSGSFRQNRPYLTVIELMGLIGWIAGHENPEAAESVVIHGRKNDG